MRRYLYCHILLKYDMKEDIVNCNYIHGFLSNHVVLSSRRHYQEGWSKAMEVVLALDVYCVKPVCEQTGSAVLF